ncbi:MAG: malto-oligosyltrehalose trehalohydrolase [Dehalococcoidia bacterium]
MNAADAVGAVLLDDGRRLFRVWAPKVQQVEISIKSAQERTVQMESRPFGYHEAVVDDVPAGALYMYRLDGERERPDPASRSQPEGVHGPSGVVDPAFQWTDESWLNLPLEQYVTYELHVGTFTGEGTFDAVIPHLAELKDLGVTAVELLPVSQFLGERNWGYDGVYPYAAQSTYGGPDGLRRLVDACHAEGVALILDVVYNHMGPEGNYITEFGHYFSDEYRTPWGSPINFDGPDSDEVRRFFIQNALYWIEDCHVDALRLDAVHAIFDFTARPFLQQLGEEVHALAARTGRPAYLIAESALNDPRIIRGTEKGGIGLDSQWNDDFHHALHVALSGEQDGYYKDYAGLPDLRRSFEEGYVYTGQRSEFRNRRFGAPVPDAPPHRFVVFSQNHDQIGNRMLGERLGALVSFDELKLAAGLVLLSPYLPLIFMGEEYGEDAPFLYFVSHSDPDLVEAVRNGRREEFSTFLWKEEPPDPQSEETFLRSKLNHRLASGGHHRVLREFYRELLRLRREHPALANPQRDAVKAEADEANQTLVVWRRSGFSRAVMAANFMDAQGWVSLELPDGQWRVVVDSADEKWGGNGGLTQRTVESDGPERIDIAAHSFVFLEGPDST